MEERLAVCVFLCLCVSPRSCMALHEQAGLARQCTQAFHFCYLSTSFSADASAATAAVTRMDIGHPTAFIQTVTDTYVHAYACFLVVS